MPPIPDPHTLAVLVLTGVALILFTRDNIPLESSSLLVIVLLAVGFEVFPYHGEQGELKVEALFHGFGHEALIAVCALMIAGQGLVRTGALEPIGRVLSTLWGTHPGITLLATLIVAAVFSAFVNNTPIVVLLLPVLTSVALRTGTAPASILMPMGLATLVGGMATTIGTSTNLLVVSVAADLDLPRFGMFDFAMPVVVAGSLGLLYLWLLAPRMIPDRSAPLSDLSPRLFSAQLRLTEESKAVGESLSDATRRAGGDMKVSRIRRDDDVYIVPLPDAVLREGDSLVLTDTPQNLKEFESALGATLFSGDQPVDDEHPLTAVDQQMAELVVVHGSPADGHTLRALRFLERYQLAVLALHRAGRMMDPRGASVADITLRTGDVLLVQGSTEQVQKVKQDNELLILDATSDVPKTRKASMALMILCAIVLCAAVGILPIAVSASAGALLMILTGCLSWRDATNALSAPVVLIVAASLALGAALQQTQGTQYMTDVFLALTAGASSSVTLSGLMLLMAVLTNVVSNNAAAVIGTPIAVGIATALDAPAEPFVLAVLFGANMSYATPMSYKTNLLVMTAGGYRFSDFLWVGIPLTVIMWVSLSGLLLLMYDL